MKNIPKDYIIEIRNETRPSIKIWRIGCNTRFHAKMWCSTAYKDTAIKIIEFAEILAIPITIQEVIVYEDEHIEYFVPELREALGI